MAAMLNLIGGALSIVALVCWILVLIQMFQRGATTPAILSIVLIICGIGPLIAFVYGWMKASEWGIFNIMAIWTVCIFGSVIFNGAVFLMSTQAGL